MRCAIWIGPCLLCGLLTGALAFPPAPPPPGAGARPPGPGQPRTGAATPDRERRGAHPIERALRDRHVEPLDPLGR